ncbi:MAG: adenylate/guanylate cyclase domain-containing protein [Syntrophobacteraceae bacterium]
MGMRSRFRQFPPAVGALLFLLVCAAVIGLRSGGKLQFLEIALYDHFVQLQPQVSFPESRILLVTISEADINNLGHWPMSDGEMARLLQNLIMQGPRVIGLDIYRDIPVPPGGEELVRVFSNWKRIVTVRKIGDEGSPGVPPPYMVSEGNQVGSNNIVIDPRGVVRRGLLFLSDKNGSYRSFPMLVASCYLAPEHIFPVAAPSAPTIMKLGQAVFVPLKANDGAYVELDAGGYQFLLDFSAAGSPFPSISLTDALSGLIPAEKVWDKAVLIGSVAESLTDFFHIPVNRPSEGQRISGVELQASIVSQLMRCALDGVQPMRFLSKSWEHAWTAVWGIAGLAIGLWCRSFRRFLLLGGVALLALYGTGFTLFRMSYWIPVVPPALAAGLTASLLLAYNSFLEKRDRALLMHLFSSHLSQEVATDLWNKREQFMDGRRPRPQALTATVLFTDLRDFTTATEKMDAGVFMDWLNEYMDAMAIKIMEHGGVVNRYIGDGILAVFGVPIPRETEEDKTRDALKAVRCALSMGKELDRLNSAWEKKGLPGTKMRVGIYTGPLMVGHVGNVSHMEYSVFGDTVNIASRLESFDKKYDQDAVCRTLIGEETWMRVNHEFETRDLGENNLKGKVRKTRIFHVLKPKEAPRNEMTSTLAETRSGKHYI